MDAKCLYAGKHGKVIGCFRKCNFIKNNFCIDLVGISIRNVYFCKILY